MSCSGFQLRSQCTGVELNLSLNVFISDPWTMAFSKSSMKKFFYNKQTKQSTYCMDPGAIAPFGYVPKLAARF